VRSSFSPQSRKGAQSAAGIFFRRLLKSFGTIEDRRAQAKRAETNRIEDPLAFLLGTLRCAMSFSPQSRKGAQSAAGIFFRRLLKSFGTIEDRRAQAKKEKRIVLRILLLFFWDL
jgi:hypothetical protein